MKKTNSKKAAKISSKKPRITKCESRENLEMKESLENEKSSLETSSSIIFNSNMRKVLVEGVLQDIKGVIESKSDGLVEVSYNDYSIGTYEFGFKLHAVKTSKCNKQMFIEATSAIVNIVNYMFQGNGEQYDIAVFTEDEKLEVEFVSKW